MDKENARRSGKKTTLKPVSKEGVGAKRRIIGVSDYPKPYKSEHKVYLGEKKREHSVERLTVIYYRTQFKFEHLFPARIILAWQIPQPVSARGRTPASGRG